MKEPKMILPTMLLWTYFSWFLWFQVEDMYKFYHTNEINKYNFVLELNIRLQLRVVFMGEKQHKYIKKAMCSQVQNIWNKPILSS